MRSNKPSFELVEQRLRDGLVYVPDDFTERVISQVTPARRHRLLSRCLQVLSWSGACVGGCLGLALVLRFVFGIWLASAAG